MTPEQEEIARLKRMLDEVTVSRDNLLREVRRFSPVPWGSLINYSPEALHNRSRNQHTTMFDCPLILAGTGYGVKPADSAA